MVSMDSDIAVKEVDTALFFQPGTTRQPWLLVIRRCGEPVVGETLACSQPEITGGSGDYTINYYWQDINSKPACSTWAQRKL